MSDDIGMSPTGHGEGPNLQLLLLDLFKAMHGLVYPRVVTPAPDR